MICHLVQYQTDPDGKICYRCKHCPRKVRLQPSIDPSTVKAKCNSKVQPYTEPPPPDSVGTEFMLLTQELGLRDKAGCNCAALRVEMNKLGIDGCKQHRDRLIGELRANAEKYGIGEKAIAAARAVTSGLAARINWIDPLPGLFDEAIRRAQVKEWELRASIDMAGVTPHSRLRIDPSQLVPNPHQFNCSLFRWRDRWLLAYRVGWQDARLALAELDDAMQVQSNWILPLPYTAEDPRLFTFRGELHVSFTAPKRNGDRWTGSRVGYAKIEEGWRLAGHWQLPSPLSSDWEKNWAFFEHRNELHAVYSISPHRVAKINGDKLAIVAEYPCDLKLGLLHGGAPPVLYQGEYYHWFHRIVGRGEARRYSLDLYTFEAKSPFKPVRQIPGSLLLATDSDRPLPTIPHCVFPGGAMLTDDDWLISYGYYDKWCELIRFRRHEVERATVPLDS